MSSNKSILLVTENRDSEFSKKVINASRLSKKKLLIEDATFKTLSHILRGKVGVIVLDRDELSGVADDFFRAVRMFRSHTPVLMPFSKKLILEQLVTHAHDRQVSKKQLAKILADAIYLNRQATKDLPISYSFERDIKLQSLARMLVKSLNFDRELSKAENEFNKRLKKIKHLTGSELDQAIKKIRKEVYTAPVFARIRRQMANKAKKIIQEPPARVMH